MRILVVSDIHGNFEALRSLPSSGFDHVLCLGDLVDYGPDPKPCIEWVRDHAAIAIEGNHDLAVSARVDCRCAPPFHALSEETRQLMWRILDAEHVEFLGTRPETAQVTLGGVRFHLVHATPSDHLYRYLPPTEPDRWRSEVEAVDADIILVGHTHLPMILELGDKLVVNPGSVGLPRQHDPRACFAIIEDGLPRLERVEYDVDVTVSALERASLSAATLTRLSDILRHGGAS
jgi:putative phosphoesterase